MRKPALMGVLAIVASILCQGQNCSTVSVVTPSGVPSSIPEGTYSGQVSITARLLVNGAKQSEQTSTENQTQAFGDSGEPLNSQNSPLYVGYKETKTFSNSERHSHGDFDPGGHRRRNRQLHHRTRPDHRVVDRQHDRHGPGHFHAGLGGLL